MTQKITAWSFSRWNTYQECPLKAKLKFIDKLKEPQGEALARGEDIHKKIERYLREGGACPPEAKQLRKEYGLLRKSKPLVELQMAFNEDWKPVDWFARDAWCRVMVDALSPPVADSDEPCVDVIDHKTGKIKEGQYDAQLELYGLAGLIRYPIAVRASASLWFVDHGRILPEEPVIFLRKDEKAYKKAWESRVKPMMSDAKFSPRPGNYCRWCHFRKGNDGPCPY